MVYCEHSCKWGNYGFEIVLILFIMDVKPIFLDEKLHIGIFLVIEKYKEIVKTLRFLQFSSIDEFSFMFLLWFSSWHGWACTLFGCRHISGYIKLSLGRLIFSTGIYERIPFNSQIVWVGVQILFLSLPCLRYKHVDRHKVCFFMKFKGILST